MKIQDVCYLFTEDVKVKVFSFLSGAVRNNAGVPPCIFYCSRHQTQAPATWRLNLPIIIIYLLSSWNVSKSYVSINLLFFCFFFYKRETRTC